MGKRRRERAPVAERNCASAHSAHRCMQRMCRKYPVRRRLVCPNNTVVSASRAENSRGLYVTPAEFAGALHKRLRESRNVRFSGATKKKKIIIEQENVMFRNPLCRESLGVTYSLREDYII